jgi:hypothetical protein
MGNCRLGVPRTGNSSATSSVLMITTKLAFVDARRHLRRRCRMSSPRPVGLTTVGRRPDAGLGSASDGDANPLIHYRLCPKNVADSAKRGGWRVAHGVDPPQERNHLRSCARYPIETPSIVLAPTTGVDVRARRLRLPHFRNRGSRGTRCRQSRRRQVCSEGSGRANDCRSINDW